MFINIKRPQSEHFLQNIFFTPFLANVRYLCSRKTSEKPLRNKSFQRL